MPRLRLELPTPILPVQLDWRAYFLEFCSIHGRPIEWKGRLLFEDCWTYSCTDYRGPEWSPPDDPRELDVMRTAYWVARLGDATRTHLELSNQIGFLMESQRVRSAPLQQVVRSYDEAKEQWVPHYHEIDYTTMEERLGYLAADIVECKDHLSLLHDNKVAV